MASATTNVKSLETKLGAACAGAQNMPGAKIVEYTFVAANPYAVGGDVLAMPETPNKILCADMPSLDDTLTYIPLFVNGVVGARKMKLIVRSTGVEAAAIDASACTFKYQVIGY